MVAKVVHKSDHFFRLYLNIVEKVIWFMRLLAKIVKANKRHLVPVIVWSPLAVALVDGQAICSDEVGMAERQQNFQLFYDFSLSLTHLRTSAQLYLLK